jgi:NADPH2:quinone reductase
VTACGVCASELPLRLGQLPDELPAEIGHEIAGVVEAVGARAASLRPDDHVVVWVADGGGFADRLVAEASACIAVPEGLPHAWAA